MPLPFSIAVVQSCGYAEIPKEAQLADNGFVRDLLAFFKTARHLWGRCPDCGCIFRLSDAAITTSPEPPKDWLRRLQKQQAALAEKEADVAERELEIAEREEEVRLTERDLRDRENRLERDARNRVRQILSSNTEVQKLIKDSNKVAVQQSRATLLGKLLERLAPCFRTFQYDPRDMRCISDPVDYVLFDGLTVERQVKQIAFIEVKCGTSKLSPVQRSIREVVERNKVSTEVWYIGNPDIPITKQLPAKSRAAAAR